nr:hypothetical protein [Tanacetum cinerariifolium]
GCVLVLRFVSCDLALRFDSAFCLIKDLIAFCLREALPNSNPRCVLSQIFIAFCLICRRMIATPGELDLPVLVPKSFHEQTDEELTETDIKRIDADDQANQTILLGLPEDVYATNGGIQGAQNTGQDAGVQGGGNQNGLVVVPGISDQNGTGTVVAARAEGTGIENQARDVTYLQTQLLIFQKEEAVIQLQTEEFDFMAAAGDLDEIEKVNANCILMANLQQASTSGTQHDKAPVYDTDGSTEEDKFLDKEVDLEAKIKDLENILHRRDQPV